MGGMLPTWMKDVRDEDIQRMSATAKDMVETLGRDTALQVFFAFGGATIYIPKMDTLYDIMRTRKIKEEYDGSNAWMLAKKYSVSESWVRRLVGGRLDGQLDMFDFVDDNKRTTRRT